MSGLMVAVTGVLMILSLQVSKVWAEPSPQWADPMATPAIPSSIGHRALLLDLAKLERHRSLSHRWVAVGEQGIILYSDDEGQVWQQARVPVQTTLTSVSFANHVFDNVKNLGNASSTSVSGSVRHRLGWAVGHDGVILFSDDSGQSWARQLDGPTSNQAILASARQALALERSRLQQLEQRIDANQNRGVHSEALVEAQLVAVEDAEIALEDARYDTEQGAARTFLDVLFISHQQGFAVGSYGTLFETQDAGRNWHEVSVRVPNPERLHINSISQLDEDHLLMVGEMGLMLLSSDRGASWRALDSPYAGSLFNSWVGDDQLMISGLRGQLYRTPLAGFLSEATAFKGSESPGEGTEPSDDIEFDGSELNGIGWRKVELNTRQTLLAGDYREGHFWFVGNGGQLVQIQESRVSEYQLPGAQGLSAIGLLDGAILVVGESGVLRLRDPIRLIQEEVRSLPYSNVEVESHGEF